MRGVLALSASFWTPLRSPLPLVAFLVCFSSFDMSSIYIRAVLLCGQPRPSQWQSTEICSYHLNNIQRLQDRLQRVLTPRAPLAVAYAWLLCTTGLDRERYYFGSAIGASGLCFALQVREKAVSVLPGNLFHLHCTAGLCSVRRLLCAGPCATSKLFSAGVMMGVRI